MDTEGQGPRDDEAEMGRCSHELRSGEDRPRQRKPSEVARTLPRAFGENVALSAP